MKWKDIESVSALRRGDVVTSRASGELLTVVAVGPHAVAVRSVVLTDANVEDWLVQRPDHEPVSWAEGGER